MNFTQLQQLLVIDGNALTITGSGLSSTSITALLTPFFTGGSLTITDAAATSSAADQTVTVSGQTTLLAVTVGMTAVFSLADGNAQLTLTATPPAGWSFATSYPAIAANPLGTAGFADVTWTLRSAAGAPAGFWFSGTWTVDTVLAPLAWLIAGSGTMEASGLLTEAFGLPQVALQLGGSVSHTFGSLDVDVQLGLQSTAYPGKFPGSPAVLTTSYVLSTNLSYQNGGTTIQVPIRAYFTTKVDVLFLVADTAQALTIPIGEIASWIGGQDLTSAGMPSTLAADTLSIDMLQLVISSGGDVLAASMTLGLDGTWSVIPDVVTIGDLALNVYVSNPFSSSRLFSNVISGTLDIDIAGDAPVPIEVTATLPNFTVQGALPDGNTATPSLAGFMAGGHGVGATAGFTDDLTIQQLLFFADPSSSTYRFQVSVTDDWQVTSSVALTALSLIVADAGDDLTAVADVGLQIGSVGLLLSAVYDSSSSGWQLAGATGPGQAIAIGDFVQEVDALFGSATTLPASLQGLTISNLALSLNTATVNLTLTFELTMPVNGATVDATILADYVKDQSGLYQITFSGTVEVGGLDGQSFALIFNEEGGA